MIIIIIIVIIVVKYLKTFTKSESAQREVSIERETCETTIFALIFVGGD